MVSYYKMILRNYIFQENPAGQAEEARDQGKGGATRREPRAHSRKDPGTILWDYITGIYYRIILQNRITESYYESILQNQRYEKDPRDPWGSCGVL